MALTTLSLISSYKAIQQEEVLPYELINLNFIGGSYTSNNGTYPFVCSSTRASMLNFDSSDITSTQGRTLWSRYKLTPTSFARIISFGRTQDSNVSQIFISYSGTNYTRYDINARVNNTTYFNEQTQVLFNSNNTYNLFFTFINISNVIYVRLYIYDINGVLLHSNLNINFTKANYDARPFNEFDFYFENAFGGGPSSGTLFIAGKFTKVLNTTEMSSYSTQTL
jgi:hypothetical protein